MPALSASWSKAERWPGKKKLRISLAAPPTVLWPEGWLRTDLGVGREVEGMVRVVGEAAELLQPDHPRQVTRALRPPGGLRGDLGSGQVVVTPSSRG